MLRTALYLLVLFSFCLLPCGTAVMILFYTGNIALASLVPALLSFAFVYGASKDD